MKALKSYKNYFIMTLGAMITALSIHLFLAPNRLAVGGVSGLSTAFHYVTGFSIGFIALVINIPIFIVGVIFLGKKFGVASLYATIMLSVFLDLFNFVPPLTNDMFIASLFGGLMAGAGLGLVFIAGATTGGTDIVAKLLIKGFRHISMGKALIILDVTVIIVVTIIFKDIQVGFYSFISLYASSFMIDNLIEGFGYAKIAFVVSDNSQQIAKDISSQLKRGVTGLNGMGMYSDKHKIILMCTVRGNQIPSLKDIVVKCDPMAFVIVTDAREVLGEGFKNYE